MIRLLRFIGVGLMALSIWLVWPASNGVVLAEPGADAVTGKTVWTAKNCKSCHGNDAEGRTAAPLAGTALSAADVTAKVRNNASHPSYRTDQVSDADLSNMTDYFKSLAKPASFTAVTYTPKAGDDPGKVLFNQKQCSTCHGENAERLAQIVIRTNRNTITQDEITKQLRSPRQNMPMFSTQLVSDSEVATLVPFIKKAVETAAANPQPAQTPAAQQPAQQPSTLPRSGAEAPTAAWAFALALLGVTLLGLSFILRRLVRHS